MRAVTHARLRHRAVCLPILPAFTGARCLTHRGMARLSDLSGQLTYRDCSPARMQTVMGGDYRRDRGRVPPFCLGDASASVPPIIATFSKQKLDFFHFDYYISVLYIAVLYHKTFIPFHFHAFPYSEEYAILA